MLKIKDLLIYASLILFIFACASKKEKINTQGLTVDWTKVEERAIPDLDSQEKTYIYGPQNVSQGIDTKSVGIDKSVKPIAFILGPGGYRCLSTISFLKEVELVTSMNPSVIIGHGLSSIVAAYYAFGFKPDYIEWKFFQFLRKANTKKVFSKEWKAVAEEVLIKEFVGKRIEDSKLTLIVPVYDIKNKKIVYKTRGDLNISLMANINLTDFVNNGPIFTKELVDKKLLAKLGIQKTLGIDLISQGISWKVGSGYLNGVYEKAASQFLRKKDTFDYSLSFPLKDYPMDDVASISKLMFFSQSFSKDQLALFMKE